MSAEQRTLLCKAEPAEPAVPAEPDPRDAAIERLERTLAEERDNASRLRNTVEEARFKLEILEKSYAKQLADARQRSETAERVLADEQARSAARDHSLEEAQRSLKETRTELARVSAEHDRLQKQVAPSRSSRTATPARDVDGSQPREALTIDDLLVEAGRPRKDRPEKNPHLVGQVSAEQEASVTEMISPELVFPKKRGEDDQEK